MNRRRILGGLAMVMISALAACAVDGREDTERPASPAPQTATPSASTKSFAQYRVVPERDEGAAVELLDAEGKDLGTVALRREPLGVFATLERPDGTRHWLRVVEEPDATGVTQRTTSSSGAEMIVRLEGSTPTQEARVYVEGDNGWIVSSASAIASDPRLEAAGRRLLSSPELSMLQEAMTAVPDLSKSLHFPGGKPKTGWEEIELDLGTCEVACARLEWPIPLFYCRGHGINDLYLLTGCGAIFPLCVLPCSAFFV